MEGLISDRLKHYSFFRTKLLDNPLAAHQFFQNSLLFHILIALTTLFILVIVFAETRSLTLFSLHPLCMSIGTFIFLAEGLVAYRNSGLLDTLSPIMQHTKRTKVRSIHQSMQLVGSGFLALGTLMIVANKIEFQMSIMPSSVHSVVGCATLAAIVIQAVSGQQKLQQMEVSSSKIRRWHGDAGLLIWDLLCLATATGVMAFATFGLASLLVEACVCTVWFAVHSQMKAPRNAMLASGGQSRSRSSLKATEEDNEGPHSIDNDFVDCRDREPGSRDSATASLLRMEDGGTVGEPQSALGSDSF